MRPSSIGTESLAAPDKDAPPTTGAILVLCNDLNVASTGGFHPTSRQKIEKLVRGQGYTLLDTRLVTASPEMATGRLMFGFILARTIRKNNGNPQSGVSGIPRVIVVCHNGCDNFRAALTHKHHTPSPSRLCIIRDGYRRGLAKHLHKALGFWTHLSGRRISVVVELRLWAGDELTAYRQHPSA